MRVLLITQYFYPENFKSNDIAFELVKRGYEVNVLTSIPNYPAGKFFNGYGVLKKRVETINGCKIYRCFQTPRGDGKGLKLPLNYFSFVFTSFFWVLYLAIFKKHDSIIVHEPSPITQGIPAVILKKLTKTPLYFWVLDLWPESLQAAGGIKNKHILSCFERITKWIYKNSDKVLISSRGFEESIVSKGIDKKKIIYFPNWAEDVFINKKQVSLPELPTGFKIMFAGNIGEAQDFDSIMNAALSLKANTDIHFIIIGDGRKKTWVENFIKEHSLANVHLLGRYPIEYMPSFFNKADIMLITLKDELLFNITVPAKLQAYMASGKPILGMLNGEGNNIIKEANCGYSVNAGNYEELKTKILSIYDNRSELSNLAENSYSYYKTYFTQSSCINKLCNIINK